MTIAEAITNIDTLKPNPFSTAEKVAWLYTLDSSVRVNVCDCYTENVELSEYSASDTTTELLVPSPWDKMYEYYLAGEIDRLNEETALYNNDMALFNSTMADFRNHYNRTHEHKRATVRFL